MRQNRVSCIKCVGGIKICSYCCDKLIVHGKAASGKTRYKCKGYCKTQVEYYAYLAYCRSIDRKIIQFIKEGLGIRGISRILKSQTSLLYNGADLFL